MQNYVQTRLTAVPGYKLIGSEKMYSSALSASFSGNTSIIVIADDLTGANDTGCQLAENGFNVLTVLSPEKVKESNIFNVFALNTETRNIHYLKAREKLSSVCKELTKWSGEAIFFKKIDSTLRGNLAVEVEECISGLKPALVVFAAAFPANGRTTVEGRHYVHGVPLHLSEAGRDPVSPVRHSDVNKILTIPDQKYEPFEHVNIDRVRNEKGLIRDRLLKGVQKKLSFDAENDKDLYEIVNSVLEIYDPRDVLWVGCAGLADQLGRQLAKRYLKKKKVLAVVGSLNRVSLSQLAETERDEQIHSICFDVANLSRNLQDEKDRVVAESVMRMEEGKNVIISTLPLNKSLPPAIDMNEPPSSERNNRCRFVAESLGDIVLAIIKAKNLAGLFLTGGDTSFHVIEKMECSGIVLEKELQPGIIKSRILDGPFADLRIITKAGGFGKENTILECIRCLEDS